MLAVSDNGNAVVAWKNNDGLSAVCYSASLAVWEKSVSILSGATWVEYPSLAVDGSGNAFLVWEEGSVMTSVYGTRYSVASKTWETPALLENGTYWDEDPKVAADYSGSAMVVWSQFPAKGLSPNVFFRRFHAATGSWGSDALLQGAATGGPIAMNKSSHALAVWVKYDVIYAGIYK